MSIRPYRRNLVDNRFDDFYDMIDSFFNDSFFTPQSALRSSTFKVDISETESAYKVEAELPGFNKDEIEINFERGKLTITAAKEESEEKEEKNYVHRERKSTQMSRTMFFKNIDEDNMKAKLDGGVLEIEIPKKAVENSSKKIEIE